MMKFIKRQYRLIMMCYYKLKNKGNISVGKDFCFRKHLLINVQKGGELIIGDGVFVNNDCSINCRERIIIGNNSIIGECVKMYDHDHQYRNKDALIKNQAFRTKPIEIGDNCWIGSNVVVLKGVTIGNNSVIGAGCVLRKSVPENTLVIQESTFVYKSLND